MTDQTFKFATKDDRLWYYRAKVLRIVDGDTAEILLDRGMHEFAVLKVRLAGIDAPEKRPRVGTDAQKTEEKRLAALSSSRLEELVGGKEILIRTSKAGKFGRYLAYLYLPDDETKTANQVLLDEGHAVVYGEPRPWRDE